MSALVVTGETEELTKLYRLGTRMLASLLFPVAMVLAVFAEDLVCIWTGNPDLATSVAPIISILSIGSALHGVMYFPYALQLAHGNTAIALRVNTILMVVLTPMLILLALTYGAVGGAVAWFILHLFNVFLATWITHRHFLKGMGTRWLCHDIGLPMVFLIVAGLFTQYVIQGLESPVYIKLIGGFAVALLVSIISILTSSPLRVEILSWLRREKITPAI